ncbi:MAG: hypothetical protein CME67_02485 [Halobacteriovoraceae bacterium]|nr:hypothetical protein [Halobacteriovoraceae bacterium]|tara:strand:- start:2886 stop:4112 length:1227 start_codon:yes stop_codon:yes gene_type:complete
MKKLTRLTIKIHRILGLALALNFFILCLSGTILIWKDELSGQGPETTASISSDGFVNVQEYVLKNYPTKKLLSIFIDDSGNFQARLGKEGQEKFRGAIKLKFDPQGKLLHSKTSKDQGLLALTLAIHRELLIPGKGKYLVGLLGLFITFLLLSGFIIAPKFYKNFKAVNNRLRLGILHKQWGLASFSWILLVTLTGILLSFNGLMISLFLKSSLDSERLLSKSGHSNYVQIETVQRNAKTALPDFSIDYVSYPDNEFSLPGHFAVLVERGSLKKILFVEGQSGDVSKVVSLPWYMELMLISEPLHFGNYGGVLLKVFWTIMGLGASLIPLSGIIIFLARKKIINLEAIKLPKSFRKKSILFIIFAPMILVFISYYSSETWKGPVGFMAVLMAIYLFNDLFLGEGRRSR